MSLSSRRAFAFLLVAPFLLVDGMNALAAPGSTPKCDKYEGDNYLYPGEWEGKFELQQEVVFDHQISTRHFGKQRFLISPQGRFDSYTASAQLESKQKLDIQELDPSDDETLSYASDMKNSGESSLEVDETSLPILQPGQTRMFITEFKAKGEMSLKHEYSYTTVSEGTKNRKRSLGGGAVEFTFRVEQATCESIWGYVHSDLINRDQARLRAEGAVAEPPRGIWKVQADENKLRMLSDYRARLKQALNAPLGDAAKAMEGARAVWSDVTKSVALRECLQQEWIDRVNEAMHRWVNDSLAEIRAARAAKTSACANQPIVQRTISLARELELGGCYQSGLAGVQGELNSLLKSYGERIAKGEFSGAVLGNPCPTQERDPAKRKAMEEYLKRMREQ